MKKCKRLERIVIIFVVFISMVSSAFSSASYRIDDLRIRAEIKKDGSVLVTEQVLYSADKINGILYNVDAKGYGELKNLNVFYEENGEFIPAVKQRGSQRGNFTVSEDDGLYKIKLYYPLRNEREYFAVRYILPQGVTVYKDTAQFNRKMVGENWEKSIRNVQVTVELPEEISKEKIYAFGHGPLTGNVEILNGREIKYTLENYYPGEFLETNILFPKELVSEINKKYIKNKNAFSEIMKMEKNFAEEANRERDRAVKTMGLKWLVFGAVACWIIFVGTFIYLKNGKRYKVKAPYGEYFRELPDDYTPAVAGAVVSRTAIKPEHLFATVMDLVRKDFLELIEEGNQTILRRTEERDFTSLKPYEKYVLDWYINDMGDGMEVVLENVEKYISGSRNAKKFYSKYQVWYKGVADDLKNLGIVKAKSKKIPTLLGVFTGFLMFPGGVFMAQKFGEPKFMIFTFGAIPFIIFSGSKRKLSLEAEEAYARWSAFKKFLVDYSNLEEAKTASIHIWEHYFVYAVALGVAEKVAKAYKKISALRGEEENIGVGRYYRPSLMNSYMYSRAFRNVERYTAGAASRSIREVSKSNHSSAGGRGGGFSGGSSGGGGGRGGGGAF
jgi:uncharacterized membrane protein